MPKRGKLIFSTKKGNVDKHMLRTLKRASKRAEFSEEQWSLHKFRRTFCTRLFERGLSLREVMALMGHN